MLKIPASSAMLLQCFKNGAHCYDLPLFGQVSTPSTEALITAISEHSLGMFASTSDNDYFRTLFMVDGKCLINIFATKNGIMFRAGDKIRDCFLAWIPSQGEARIGEVLADHLEVIS